MICRRTRPFGRGNANLAAIPFCLASIFSSTSFWARARVDMLKPLDFKDVTSYLVESSLEALADAIDSAAEGPGEL